MAGLTFNNGRNADALTSDSSLNVGVGVTPSGSYKLEVNGKGKFSNDLTVQHNQNASSTSTFSNSDTTGLGSRQYLEITAGDVTLQLAAINTDAIYLQPTTSVSTYLGYNSAGGNALYLKPNGNVLVNTNTDAGYKLDVNGTGRFGGTNTYNGFLIGSHSNNVGAAIYNKGLANATLYADSASTVLNAETNLFLRTGNTDRLTIASTGAATFSSSVTAGTSVFASNYITDPTTGNATTNGTVYALNAASTNNSFGLGVGAIRNSAYDMWFQTGAINGGGYRWYIGTSEKMTMSSTGNVAIGTTSADWLLKIEKNSSTGGGGTYPALVVNNPNAAGYSAMYFFSGATNKGGLEFSNGTNELLISSVGTVKISTLGTGAVTATSGVLSTTSDMNLKISDGYIDTALDKILKLTPRYFYWKEESGLPTDLRQLGFYAQEVNEVLGEEVANTPKTENDKWGIYDRGIIAMLVKSIQELEARLKIIENK